jgi:hypothetical protein
MHSKWIEPRRRGEAREREADMLLELISPYISVVAVGVFWVLAVRRPMAVAQPARRRRRS